MGPTRDCDRIGVLVKNDGEYTVLTGNQTACLLLNYILTQKKNNGTLPENGAVVKTIVSTDLAKTICKAFGVTVIDVLTGFKFIAEQMDISRPRGSIRSCSASKKATDAWPARSSATKTPSSRPCSPSRSRRGIVRAA